MSGLMRLLFEEGLARGPYAGEDTDTFEWLQAETADVAAAVAAGEDPAAVLIDTGWWHPEWGPFDPDLRARIIEAAS